MAGQNPQAVANLLRNIYESQQYQTNAPAPFQHQGFAVTNWLGLTGHNSIPKQLLAMFNPTTTSGLVNLASMLVPGGGKFDASPRMGELGMPGQFEQYSLEKSPATDQFAPEHATKDRSEISNQAQGSGIGFSLNRQGALHQARLAYEESSPRQKELIAKKYGILNGGHAMERVRYLMDNAAALRAQKAHDMIFGDMFHGVGPVPKRPSVPEFRPQGHSIESMLVEAKLRDEANMNQAAQRAAAHRNDMQDRIAERLGISREHVQEQYNRVAAQHAADERAAAGAEHHFFSGQVHPYTELHPYGPHSQPSFNEHMRNEAHSNRPSMGGLRPHDLVNAVRRAKVLSRFYRQQAFNHRN